MDEKTLYLVILGGIAGMMFVTGIILVVTGTM